MPEACRRWRFAMIDVKTADKELQTYIRPQTFPVAIRMLKPGEEIPERAKRPARDFKKLSMSCQVIDMARRYGWTIALTREDHICSLGIIAIGFDKPLPIYNVGTLCEGMYTETKEAGQPPRVLLRGPRGVRRHHRYDDANGRAAGDPPVLGRPHLRPDAGPRDGLQYPVGPDGGDHRGPARHAQRGHPLSHHPVHGV